MITQGVFEGAYKPQTISFETLVVDGRVIATNAEGYLLDASDWSPEVTEQMAARDGVALTDDHWLLINFLHRFYRDYRVAPEMSVLSHLSHQLCRDQRKCCWNRKYIRELFPQDEACACRYAGLPAPLGRYCG